MNRYHVVRFLIICLIVGVFSLSQAKGQDINPQQGGFRCRFMYQGVEERTIVYVEACYWGDAYEPWDGVYTGQGNRHSHYVPGHVYPFEWKKDTWITPEMTDAFWDQIYLGYTRLSGATFARNCHGYAIGFNGWPGMPVVVQDDYTPAVVREADIYYNPDPEGSHSIRIDGICANGCDWDTVAVTTEKNGTSGVYKAMYYCPAGGYLPTWRLYKRN